jgi:hypothetical protein
MKMITKALVNLEISIMPLDKPDLGLEYLNTLLQQQLPGKH